MASSRLQAAVNRVRGAALKINPEEDIRKHKVPPKVLHQVGEWAAKECTPLCRRFVKQNMSSAGITSPHIAAAVDRSVAYFDPKGAVKFRLGGGLGRRPNDARPEALYIQLASLDAGWVAGGKSISAATKRVIKEGAETKTNAGAVTVVPGRDFFKFTSAQNADIRKRFRTLVAAELMRRGYGNARA